MMKVICKLFGCNYVNGACKRCGDSMDYKSAIRLLAMGGHVMSRGDIARNRAALLGFPDQGAVAWEISAAIDKCRTNVAFGGYVSDPRAVAVLQEIGSAVLDQQKQGGR